MQASLLEPLDQQGQAKDRAGQPQEVLRGREMLRMEGRAITQMATPYQSALAFWQERIGTELGTSRWIRVDQPMIDQFASCTQDHQWIHVDPERAAMETPFGGTIAPGFLTLSLASRFSYDVLEELPGEQMAINYGFDRIRFVAPVLCGASVRGVFELCAVSERGKGQLLRDCALSIEIQGQSKPALTARWLTIAVFDQA